MEDNWFSRCNGSTDKARGYLVTIVLLVQFTDSVQRLWNKRERKQEEDPGGGMMPPITTQSAHGSWDF